MSICSGVGNDESARTMVREDKRASEKDQRSWEANTQLEGSVSDSFFQVYQDFSFSDSFIT